MPLLPPEKTKKAKVGEQKEERGVVGAARDGGEAVVSVSWFIIRTDMSNCDKMEEEMSCS